MMVMYLMIQVSNDKMVTIDPKNLIGRTFLNDSEEDGQRFQSSGCTRCIRQRRPHEELSELLEVCL
jgi:hypothetical protein